MNQMQIRGLLVNFILPNGCFKKIISRFLFETLSDRDDYVEVDTLTQILKSKDWLIFLFV